MADKEKLNEIYEIRQAMVNNNYRLKVVDKNINFISVNLKKNEIVAKEINGLKTETKVWDKVGRLFVISNKDDILGKLTKNHEKLRKELENQSELKKKYSAAVQEQSKQYQEILGNKK